MNRGWWRRAAVLGGAALLAWALPTWADELRLLRSSMPAAQELAADQRVLVAARFSQIPQIDGRLDDAAWAGAAATEPFVRLGGSVKAKVQTSARVGFDEQALYVAFTCDEPNLASMQATADAAHDSDLVWQDDCIEVCLQAPGAEAVYHVIVSAAGARYDERVSGASHDSAWGGDWSAAVGRGQNQWTAELRLPWSMLGVACPGEGQSWGLQLARGRRPQPEEISVWSANALGGIARSDSFGTLAFGTTAIAFQPPRAKPRPQTPTVQLRLDGSTLWVRADVSAADLQQGDWTATVAVRDPQGATLAELNHAMQGTDLVYALPTQRWAGQAVTVRFAAGRVSEPPAVSGQIEQFIEASPYVTAPRREVVPSRAEPVERGVARILVAAPPQAVNVASMPVRCGVPLPRGALRDPGQVELLDARGQSVLAQLRPLAWWEPPSDPQRSVKWLLVSFDVPTTAAAPYELHFGRAVAPRAMPSPLQVRQTDAGVEVDTGALRLQIGRAAPTLLTQVWREGQPLLADSPRKGLYVVDHEGTLYRSALDREATLQVESQGPHEAVIKADGFYVSAQGQRYNHWTTRLHVYAHRPFVRVMHSFVLTEGCDTRRLREIGLELPLAADAERRVSFPAGTPYAVAADLPEPVQREGQHRFDTAGRRSLSLHQDSHRTWKLYGEVDAPLQEGERNGHYIDVRGRRFGLSAAVRWWWQQYPNAMTWQRDEAGIDALSLQFWTMRGHADFDLRPEPFLRSKGVWDYWATQIMQAKDRRHEYPPSLGGTLAADGAGLAKTHEIALFFSGQQDHPQAPDVAYLLQQPVYAHVDPAWLDRSEALGRLHPRDVERFPDVEAVIDTHVQSERLRQSDDRYGNPEYRDSYGIVDFGDTLHNGKYAHRYWSHFFYCGPTTWWTLFARGGQREVLDFAMANARHHMDVDTCHWDVGPRKPAGAINHDDAGMFHWDYNDSYLSTSNYLTYLTYCHYLSGDERARDVAEMIGRMIRRRIESGYQATWHHRGTGMTLWNLLELYTLTWDPVIRQHCDLMAQQIKTQVRDGLSTGYGGDTPVDFTLAYIFPAAIAYHQLTGDADMAQWIVNQAVGIARLNQQTHLGKYFNQWDGMAYAWRLSGDEKLLAAPLHQMLAIAEQNRLQDVDKFVGNRVWWMQKVGYLQHALASSNSTVQPRAPAWSSAGDILLLDERDQAFSLTARLSHLAVDDPRLQGRLGDLASEAADGGPWLVLTAPDGREVERRRYPPAPRVDPWYSYGGWVETFYVKPDQQRGIYRLHLQSRGPRPFMVHLLSNTLGKAMFAGASGDGLSPNGRYPVRAQHVFFVPTDVERFSVELLLPTHLHDAPLRVLDGDGQAVVDRNIGREPGRQRDQWVSVPIECPPGQRGKFWRIDLGTEGETRFWKLIGVPGYFAPRVEEAFDPR